jgi:putative lipoprotein
VTIVLLCICAAAPLDSLPERPLCLDTFRLAAPVAEPDRWLAMDKFWHFSASFVSVGAGYQLFANRLGWDHPTSTASAAGATVTLGICKEFYDLFGPTRHFSWKDLAWDAAGIGAGYLVFIHKWK